MQIMLQAMRLSSRAMWFLSGGSRGVAQVARTPPLFLDETEAQRAEKKFFGDQATPLSQGLDLPLFL